MCAWFQNQPHPAEWVWTSSATRAQETAEFVTNGFSAPSAIEKSLYLADPETLIDVVRTTPPAVESVAVVAHNPGLTYLANMLSHGTVTENLPTFGCALFATEQDWCNLVPRHNHFIALYSPKTIR